MTWSGASIVARWANGMHMGRARKWSRYFRDRGGEEGGGEGDFCVSAFEGDEAVDMQAGAPESFATSFMGSTI
jgi:hypothetical protein